MDNCAFVVDLNMKSRKVYLMGWPGVLLRQEDSENLKTGFFYILSYEITVALSCL